MKVPDSFPSLFPQECPEGVFSQSTVLPFLGGKTDESALSRPFPPSSDWCCEKKEKGERENGKEEKFPFFSGARMLLLPRPPFYSKAPFRHDTAAKMGDQDLLFTSPILLLSVSHCCKEFNLAPKKRGERERGRDCRATNSASQGRCLIMFFHQQKNFHNGRLANLILRRFTAVRDVRRPLWQKFEIFASAPVALRKLQVMMGTWLRREQRVKKGSRN